MKDNRFFLEILYQYIIKQQNLKRFSSSNIYFSNFYFFQIRLKILSSLSNAKATDVSSLIQLGDTILVLTEKQESPEVKVHYIKCRNKVETLCNKQVSRYSSLRNCARGLVIATLAMHHGTVLGTGFWFASPKIAP